MIRRLSAIGGVAAALFALAAVAQAQPTAFDFASNLTGVGGSATLGYFNGATTSGVVNYGTAAGFGLPALPGGDATVLKFPKFAANQGLSLLPNVGPNGGSSSYINQYTMGFDVLISNPDEWFAFYQTNETNANDADFFKQPNNQGNGVGISGNYDGTLNAGEWYRVFVSVDTSNGATPTMKKYLNGVLLDTQTLGSGFDGRWSLYSAIDPTLATLLLTDNDGDNSAGYISAYYFNPTILSDSDVTAFGGPTTAGFVVAAAAPEPGTLSLALLGVGCLLTGVAHRRKQHSVRPA